MRSHFAEAVSAEPQACLPAPRSGWSLDQQFLTALAVMVFVLALLAVPVRNSDELSSRFGQEDWLAVWQINEHWLPQWQLVAGEWAALGVGYLLVFKLLGAGRREAQTFGWLRRAARERDQRHSGKQH